MNALFTIILLNICISLVSLSGAVFLSLKEKYLEKILMILVSLSAGALMGGAFLHLLPEALEKYEPETILTYTLFSFILFYLIEKVFHWRHCHEGKCEIHTFGYLNLLGDGIHNFIDGFVIAGTYLTDFKLGIITTIVVALHEIPQELGDFGVLIYAGFSKKKALFLNLLTALTAIIGGITGYLLFFKLPSFDLYLLPLAAGGFLYISGSDLLPELKKETRIKKAALSFVAFLTGIFIVYLAKFA